MNDTAQQCSGRSPLPPLERPLAVVKHLGGSSPGASPQRRTFGPPRGPNSTLDRAAPWGVWSAFKIRQGGAGQGDPLAVSRPVSLAPCPAPRRHGGRSRVRLPRDRVALELGQRTGEIETYVGTWRRRVDPLGQPPRSGLSLRDREVGPDADQVRQQVPQSVERPDDKGVLVPHGGEHVGRHRPVGFGAARGLLDGPAAAVPLQCVQ